MDRVENDGLLVAARRFVEHAQTVITAASMYQASASWAVGPDYFFQQSFRRVRLPRPGSAKLPVLFST